jgi:hypothetical protein
LVSNNCGLSKEDRIPMSEEKEESIMAKIDLLINPII